LIPGNTNTKEKIIKANEIVNSAFVEDKESPDPVPSGEFDENSMSQLVIVTENFTKNASHHTAKSRALPTYFPTVIRASKTNKKTHEKFTTNVGWTWLKKEDFLMGGEGGKGHVTSGTLGTSVENGVTALGTAWEELESMGQFFYSKYRDFIMEKRKKNSGKIPEEMNTLFK
jgi:hypothetical protein